jgi:ankyrin repeat protein
MEPQSVAICALDINAKDSENNTALDIAIMLGNWQYVLLLVRAGGHVSSYQDPPTEPLPLALKAFAKEPWSPFVTSTNESMIKREADVEAPSCATALSRPVVPGHCIESTSSGGSGLDRARWSRFGQRATSHSDCWKQVTRCTPRSRREGMSLTHYS